MLFTEPGCCVALFTEAPVVDTVGGIGGGMVGVAVAGVLPMVPGGNLALRGLIWASSVAFLFLFALGEDAFVAAVAGLLTTPAGDDV